MLRDALAALVGRDSAERRASPMLFARPSVLYGVTKLLGPLRMGEDFNPSLPSLPVHII